MRGGTVGVVLRFGENCSAVYAGAHGAAPLLFWQSRRSAVYAGAHVGAFRAATTSPLFSRIRGGARRAGVPAGDNRNVQPYTRGRTADRPRNAGIRGCSAVYAGAHACKGDAVHFFVTFSRIRGGARLCAPTGYGGGWGDVGGLVGGGGKGLAAQGGILRFAQNDRRAGGMTGCRVVIV